MGSQRNITLKGPGEKPVNLHYGDWFRKDVPHSSLYIGKSTNLKNRISQHLLIKMKQRAYPQTTHFEKVKPLTTTCQLRTGIEHIFPKEDAPLDLIMRNVGLSLCHLDGSAAIAERFYAEDFAIGYYRPWFNLDSER